jgi:solute:Na+ symporter, SSS family
MTAIFFIAIIIAYFAMLVVISFFTSKNADSNSFFIGNKQSPWFVVAFGMIGASLSGVTFISIPGWVGSSQFAYMQTVLGYMVGYLVIATVLMPLYYRLNLTSIYSYLEQRFGFWSYKTGASFFLLSRTIGASFRMFLVANVMQFTIFDELELPFPLTVIVTILLIWLYTFRGGIKTIVWTDTLQTLFMLVSVGLTIYIIGEQLQLSSGGIIKAVKESSYSKIFFFTEWASPNYFWKHFLGGTFIAIAMTGLDQDMMQKNLSCKNIGEAQKNMFWFSVMLVIVNLLFLSLGALLYIYCETNQIALPAKSDNLYPMLAMQGYLGNAVAILFVLGIIAAAYSSADSALTALTTSFCIDILDVKKYDEAKRNNVRKIVHIGMSVMMFLSILLFNAINKESVIKELFTIAGYTYGPLLGLYAFGLFTKLNVKDKFVPLICILSPVICYFLNTHSVELFNGYKFGFELLLLNGLLTFVGLWLLRRK